MPFDLIDVQVNCGAREVRTLFAATSNGRCPELVVSISCLAGMGELINKHHEYVACHSSGVNRLGDVYTSPLE